MTSRFSAGTVCPQGVGSVTSLNCVSKYAYMLSQMGLPTLHVHL